MHDSEQEHRGITGCRVTYESTIFYNEANKFSIIVVKTSDPRIPPQACNGRYYGDRIHWTMRLRLVRSFLCKKGKSMYKLF